MPAVIEILWRTLLPSGKTGSNKVHGHYTAQPPSMQSLANSLASAIGSAWGTNLAPHMSTSTQLSAVYIRDMTSAANPIFQGTLSAIPGTGTGNALPSDVALAVTENILARGKGMKGRFYLGGFVVGEDTANGSVPASLQTAVNAFGTALFNAITAQSLTPCVAQVHRQEYISLTGATIPERQASFVAVTSYVCRDLNWDTLRRRGA